jgi:hypothetical protein
MHQEIPINQTSNQTSIQDLTNIEFTTHVQTVVHELRRRGLLTKSYETAAFSLAGYAQRESYKRALGVSTQLPQ